MVLFFYFALSHQVRWHLFLDWWTNIYIKGVTDAFVLTYWNFATSNRIVKNKVTEMSLGCIIYSCLYMFLHVLVWVYILHIVGLSTLLVSTIRVMRRPQYVERVTVSALRFFCICTMVKNIKWLQESLKVQGREWHCPLCVLIVLDTSW